MKSLLVSCFLLLALVPSRASLDLYDSFNYPTTGVQLSAAGSSPWVAYAGGGSHPTNFAGSLSYPGLQTAVGDNSAQFSGGGAVGIGARNLSQLYNINNAPTLYYSLTFSVTSISTADWGGSGNYLSGSFMMGFNQKLQNGTALAQIDAGAPLLIRTGDPSNSSGFANDFQGFQLGTSPTAISSNRVFDSTHTYNPGDVLFLVLSYTFGAGAGDDTARLYVNPTPGSAENANTPVVVATGINDVANSQFQSFFVRNNSVEPTNSIMDDLRIGTTWEDVTPAAAPEPSSAVLLGFGSLSLVLLLRRFRG
jgi:hypothetical protein